MKESTDVTADDLKGFKVINIMAVFGGAEVDGIASAGLLGVGGSGFVVGLCVTAERKTTVLLAIECLLVYNLTGAVVFGDTAFGREVI